MFKSAQERSATGSTFLSHSSMDAEYVAGVLQLLQEHGAQVYVDKKDDNLPPKTSRETASVLKRRIAECRKFIVFATANSKDSRWVPWELGVSDGNKGSLRTAVFPGVDQADNVHWAEQEYLGLYDRIVFGRMQGYSQPIWMVWNQERNSAVPLQDWLGS